MAAFQRAKHTGFSVDAPAASGRMSFEYRAAAEAGLKIKGVEVLRADAGFCNACFVKVTTDDGLIGWAEFGEHTGTAGLSRVVTELGALVVGMDPCAIEVVAALLRGRTFQAPGGMNAHAIAAITNALLDIKGKSVGLPVHALFGGTVRTRVPAYRTRCGTNRIQFGPLLGTPKLRDYDDVARLGEEVRRSGIAAIKIGMVTLVDGALATVGQGFAATPGYPALNLPAEALRTTVRTLQALRAGAGPEVRLMLDVNGHLRTEGVIAMARAVRDLDLLWFEVDMPDPGALALVRSAAQCPVASLEVVYGRTGLRPFLDARGADVAIIDVVWNGYLEAVKMADFAAAYDVNVASHAYSGGGLGDIMSAHFAAAVPNFRIAEREFDEVPWKWTFVTHKLACDGNDIVVPQNPGWGADVDEAALLAHPPR